MSIDLRCHVQQHHPPRGSSAQMAKRKPWPKCQLGTSKMSPLRHTVPFPPTICTMWVCPNLHSGQIMGCSGAVNILILCAEKPPPNVTPPPAHHQHPPQTPIWPHNNLSWSIQHHHLRPTQAHHPTTSPCAKVMWPQLWGCRTFFLHHIRTHHHRQSSQLFTPLYTVNHGIYCLRWSWCIWFLPRGGAKFHQVHQQNNFVLSQEVCFHIEDISPWCPIAVKF